MDETFLVLRSTNIFLRNFYIADDDGRAPQKALPVLQTTGAQKYHCAGTSPRTSDRRLRGRSRRLRALAGGSRPALFCAAFFFKRDHEEKNAAFDLCQWRRLCVGSKRNRIGNYVSSGNVGKTSARVRVHGAECCERDIAGTLIPAKSWGRVPQLKRGSQWPWLVSRGHRDAKSIGDRTRRVVSMGLKFRQAVARASGRQRTATRRTIGNSNTTATHISHQSGGCMKG